MARKRVVSVDFDGTIVEHAFPAIGKPLPEAFEVLKELKEAGFVLILNTCREDDNINNRYLTYAVEFCKENGVEFDGVNETPLEYEFRPEKGLKRKVYAHCYIDDRNLGGFPGWAAVRTQLLG